MFGIDISIRFCKQILHKTCVGGFFSIIVLSLLALQSILIIQQLLDKTNPQVLYQQAFTNSPERFNLTRDIFTLSFSVGDSKSAPYIDPTIYSANIQLRMQERVFNTTKNGYDLVSNDRNLKLVPCTENHFQNQQTKQFYLQQDYKKLWCIDLDEKNLYIEGQFEGMKYARFQIMIDVCQNKTSSQIICKPQDQIDSKIANGRVSFFYDDHSVLSRNRYDPFQAIGKTTFWIIGPSIYKKGELAFKNSYLYTDLGWFTEEIEVTKTLSYSSDKESTIPKFSSRLIDTYISFEKNVYQEYHRKYLKVDRALSQIGGIYNILFTIGCLICKPISQVELNKKLLSSLFSFVDADDENDDQKKAEKKGKINKNNTQDVNNDKNCILNEKFLKSHSVIIQQPTADNNLKETSRLDKQQSNKNNQTEQNLNSLRKQNSEINNLPNQSNLLQSNQKEKKCNYSVDQKNEPYEYLSNSPKQEMSKLNLIVASSTVKAQISKSDDQKLKKQSTEKSSIFNFFRKKTVQNIDILKKLQSLFNKNVKEFKFKTAEFFISSFMMFKCLRKKKHQVLRYGMDKLYQHIDIFHITTKLIEFEKLKSLLLNEQQLKMFEFIPRPIIRFSKRGKTEIQSYSGVTEDSKEWNEKMDEAQLVLKQIASRGSNISYIDKRLIEILNPQFQGVNMSNIQETPRTNKDNSPEEVMSNPLIDDINDMVSDRNKVRQSIQIHEKDFKTLFLSNEKIPF